LNEEGSKTFDQNNEFVKKLYPAEEFSRLRHLLENAEKRAYHQTSVEKNQSFLSKPVSIEHLGEFIRAAGITSSHELLNGSHVNTYASPTVGLLKDLSFKRRRVGSGKDLCQWWKQLTGSTVPEVKMYKLTGKVTKKLSKLIAGAHREKG
jgi:hypothetical protein